MKLSLFRNRNFAFYVTAEAAAVFSTGFLQTALSLYMLDLTGSAAKFGLSLFVGLLPTLLIGLFAGAVVDRLDRRKVMVTLFLIRGLILAAIFGYALLQPIGEMVIYTLTALLGLCQTLNGPAQIAVMPSIMPADDLVDANALRGTVVESLQVTGPMLSALAYSATGIRFNLALCAVLFLVGAGAISFMRMAPSGSTGSRHSLAGEILEGFGLFRKDMRLTSLVVNGFLTHLFLFPLVLVGFPFIIKEIFAGSNLDVGLVESAATLGSISSVVIVAAIRKRVTISQGILVGVIGMITATLPMMLLGSGRVLALLAAHPRGPVLFFGAVTVLMFWMFGTYGVFFVTFYQRVVPRQMLGRWYGMLTLGFALGRAGGFQLYGYLLDHHPLMVSVGILAVGMVLKLLVHIPFMRLDRQMAAEEQGAV